MRIIKRRFILIAGLILLLAVKSAQAQEIRYVYDELGRLIAVMDEQGRTAIYEYDEVGNILAIRRTDATGPVAITFFNPTKGPIGTRVEIFGIGFSATPTQNTIAFNGVPAPVLAASTTTLTAEVPNGATTGPIAVTTPLGSATSPENFIVSQPVTVSPTMATVLAGGRVQFTANMPVTWHVSPPDGTISADGLYQAPATPPAPPEVIVTAVSQADSRLDASAFVHIVPAPDRLVAPSVSVKFADPPLQANPAQAPLVSVQFAAPPLQANAFQAPLVAATFAPFITSLSPTSAVAGGASFTLTVNGDGFSGATDLQFILGGSVDSNITVSSVSPAPDGRSLTATITIAGGATTGARIVRVVTPAATSTILGVGGNVFTVTTP